MKLGKIIGNVVSTKKTGNLQNCKILIVEYLDEHLLSTKKAIACIDSVNAGKGDIVLICSSSSARFTKVTKNVATDCTIVGIIDSYTVNGKYAYKKH